MDDMVRFNDTLSFVLLIDQIHTREGMSLLKKLPAEYIKNRALNIPPRLNKLMSDVVTTLLNRLEVPPEEIAEITDFIEKKEYQTMFDALVENVLEGKRQAREEGIQIGMEKGQEEGRERGRQEGRKEGIQIGVKKGQEKGREEIARKALREGASAEFVQKITGLDIDTITGLSQK
jgi:flagellar biosynthesis/type III secretory pathway protein FliH